jgi:hypothetical protein
VPEARTPRKWPYRNARPVRSRRVVKTKDEAAVRGVRRNEPVGPLFSPAKARLVLASAMLVAVAAAGWWLYQSPYLTVREPAVTGASQLTPEQVREAAGIDGDSVFALDLDAARVRVAALPKVRSVEIEKRGWTGVTIHIEERTPWGSWQMDGVNVAIDIDGYVLDGVAPEGSPVILEVEPQRVLNPGDRLDPGAIVLADKLVREADTAFGRRVLGLVYRQYAGLTAVLSAPDIEGKPMWVTFGDSRDYDYKIASLYVLMEQAEERNLALSAVDLRFGDRLSFN